MEHFFLWFSLLEDDENEPSSRLQELNMSIHVVCNKIHRSDVSLYIEKALFTSNPRHNAQHVNVLFENLHINPEIQFFLSASYSCCLPPVFTCDLFYVALFQEKALSQGSLTCLGALVD